MIHPDKLRIEEVSAAHGPGLADLFVRNQVPCHCRYWHFAGDKNAWLDRCANGVELNRSEMVAALNAGSEEMRGVVAVLEDDTIVGWLKLTPSHAVGKIYAQRLYKGLPCFQGNRSGVVTIGCLLVDEGYRRQNVARRLVAGAIVAARRRGARTIEAFPRRDDNVPDAALFAGPLSIYREAGFETVHEIGPYPVLRLDLVAR